MKFMHYFNLSLLSTMGVIAYAIYSREQFYPVVLFLVTSKVSFVVAGNMILATALLVGNLSKYVFLGQLRDAEIELLTERAKYTITETCLALTIFRNELTPSILGLFGILLFLKAFHWLARSRLEHLEQVMPVGYLNHARLTALIAVLCLSDIALSYSCMSYTIELGKSVLILFSFEFGLLVVSIFNLSNRYLLYLIDARLANGLTNKNLYVQIVDLICDALKFVTYVIFFSLVFVYYGLPIHLVRELWMSFDTLRLRLTGFIKYLRLTNNLDQRFADATPQEIEACGDCLICRERIERGKKLPCNHVFHLECLRMWLQHQQTCPLCRADIPVNAPAVGGAAPAPAGAGDGDGAGAGAEGAAGAAAVAGGGAIGFGINFNFNLAVGNAGVNVNANVVNINGNINGFANADGDADAADPADAAARARERENAIANARFNGPADANAAAFPGAGNALGAAAALSANANAVALPAFYLTTAPATVYSSLAQGEAVNVRVLNEGVVVFVTARALSPGPTGSAASEYWLQTPDGWVQETVGNGNINGEPKLILYIPPQEPLAARDPFLSPFVPQPAVGYGRTTPARVATAGGARGQAAGGGGGATSPLTPRSQQDYQGHTPRTSTFGIPFSGPLEHTTSIATPGSFAKSHNTSSRRTPSSAASLSTMIALQERLQNITANLSSMQQAVGECQQSLTELVSEHIDEIEHSFAVDDEEEEGISHGATPSAGSQIPRQGVAGTAAPSTAAKGLDASADSWASPVTSAAANPFATPVSASASERGVALSGLVSVDSLSPVTSDAPLSPASPLQESDIFRRQRERYEQHKREQEARERSSQQDDEGSL